MSRGARLCLAALLLAQTAASALYLERASFVRDDENVFVLWDDAMISMRYARNLAEGHGLVWNAGGERVQGFTNLGYVLVMAALHRLPIAVERVSLAVQAVALGAMLLSLGWIFQIARRATGSAWAGFGAALAGALFAPHWIFGLQGADTALVTALLLASIASASRADARGRPWPLRAFVPLWLAIVVRPDATIFAACAVVVAGLEHLRSRQSLRPALGGALGIVAVWSALAGFSLAYYGDPLPNTYYLKATGAPLGKVLRIGLEQLGFLALHLLPATAAAVLAFVAPQRISRAVLLLTSFSLAAVAYHTAVGGDWLADHGSRHLVQVVPLWLGLAAIGAELGLLRWSTLGTRARAATLLVLATGVGLLANPAQPAREWFDPGAPTLLHAENMGNFDRATYLRIHTDPDTTVAVHWAGVGPYFAERASIDVLGRSDRHIALMEVDRFVPGHSKWDWDYVIDERRPDVVDLVSRGLSRHPGFLANYLAARIAPQAMILVRRDSLPKLHDPDVELLELAAPATPD